MRHYTDTDLANGDPVIVVPRDENGHEQEPIHLGTGFESYEELEEVVELVSNGGNSHRLTPQTQETLRHYDSFNIYAITATID